MIADFDLLIPDELVSSHRLDLTRMLIIERVYIRMVEDLHDIRSFESVGICDEFAEFLEIVGVFVPGQRGEIFERLDAMLQREAGNEAGHFVE